MRAACDVHVHNVEPCRARPRQIASADRERSSGSASSLFVSLLVAAFGALAGIALPGAGLAQAIGAKRVCAVGLSGDCDGAGSELALAYGPELAGLVTDHVPDLLYEEGMRELPVNYRKCREDPCSIAARTAGPSTRTVTGLRATAFTRVVDCRSEAAVSPEQQGIDCSGDRTGKVFIQYWLYYPDSQTKPWGDGGFHEDDFEWKARAGFGPFRPLHVVDRYRAGRGSTEGRVFGRLRFLHAADEHTTRAAAARGAAESIWVPASLLPGRGVTWRAEADDLIVAAVSVPPEHPEVELRIDSKGAVRSLSVMRWGKVGQAEYGYIPFGGEVAGECRFGDVVIPSVVSVGWWYGTPRYTPFFEATVSAAVPLAVVGR